MTSSNKCIYCRFKGTPAKLPNCSHLQKDSHSLQLTPARRLTGAHSLEPKESFSSCSLRVQSIVYFLIHSPKLSAWLKDATIQETLQSYTKWHHIERDPQVFSVKIDEDYVHCLQGVTRASFCNVYLEWIQHCAGKMETVRVTHTSELKLTNVHTGPVETYKVGCKNPHKEQTGCQYIHNYIYLAHLYDAFSISSEQSWKKPIWSLHDSALIK